MFGLPRGLLSTVAAGMLASAPAHAQCQARETNACVLTLHGAERPSASAACTSDAWKPHLSFQQPDRFVDSNDDGWWETVLEIDLAPAKGCNCLVLRVHFVGEGDGFLLNVGDSATNDGNGGDAGTDPVHSAELQVKARAREPSRLAVFSASGDAGGQDMLLSLILPPLDRRVLEIEICDQYLDFAIDGNREQPGAGWMRAQDSQRLFAIAAPGEDLASPSKDPWIYAGFNRVIHRRRGAAAGNRTGRGVARVEIFLKP